jgi:putative ABC transport system substrate-binding protein
MRRREFLTLLGGTGATWPLAAPAQQLAGRVNRIGYLSVAFRERTLYATEAFEGGLRSLGYRIGQDVVIEYRFANADAWKMASICDQIVGSIDGTCEGVL